MALRDISVGKSSVSRILTKYNGSESSSPKTSGKCGRKRKLISVDLQIQIYWLVVLMLVIQLFAVGFWKLAGKQEYQQYLNAKSLACVKNRNHGLLTSGKKMANSPEELPPPLSTRGGALVLKSISLFLTGSRNSKTIAVNNPKQKSKRKKMTDKEIKCPARILEMAKRDTHFSKNEIEALYKIYRKLITMNRPTPRDKNAVSNNASIIGKPTTVQEGVDRTIFRELLHNTFDLITEDMLMDRIFCVWDKNNVGILTVEAWFCGLSIFLKGTVAEKLEFCFAVYDLNSDGFITKEEMFQLLKNCLIKQPQDEDPDEGAKDLAELVVRKLDKDKDGKVSLEDYQQSITEEPLLLEAFGRCLPDERACDTFLSTIKA